MGQFGFPVQGGFLVSLVPSCGPVPAIGPGIRRSSSTSEHPNFTPPVRPSWASNRGPFGSFVWQFRLGRLATATATLMREPSLTGSANPATVGFSLCARCQVPGAKPRPQLGSALVLTRSCPCPIRTAAHIVVRSNGLCFRGGSSSGSSCGWQWVCRISLNHMQSSAGYWSLHASQRVC